MSPQIKNIEDLIKSSLKPGQKFVSSECERLLQAGENYGSVMLQVKIKVINDNNEEEIIHCVAKTAPPTELIWEMFNTKVTFKKEINVYKELVPALNEFGRENGIDCIMDFFANSLGARVSANPESNEVDKDAVLLLENLKVQGYINCDRFVGFDLESAKFLLNDLAVLHATPIAYKIRKPEEFKSKILPHLKKDFSFNIENDVLEDVIKAIQNLVSEEQKCIQYLPEIGKGILKLISYTSEKPLKERDLFATFTHNDYWVNNTMLKFENGKPIKNKMVDFQVIEYRSLAHDVIFFLYSSVEVSVLENHLDDLIKYYYERFIDTLKRLKCDVSDFTFEALMEEFAYIAREEEFGHTIFMLNGIMLLKEKAMELDEIVDESSMNIDTNALHKNCCIKMVFTLLDFVKRGWIAS